MPYLSFASNFLWVMVIGLLGPSIPGLVSELKINYTQAGLFFTLLSLGSLFGTLFGSMSTDYLDRKVIYGVFSFSLCVGLLGVGVAPAYGVILIVIFFMSVLGSPIGAVGQSIMIDMYPQKRERNLSLMTSFAAAGNLCAPILVSLNYTIGLNWRHSFYETALMAFLLFTAIMIIPLPPKTIYQGEGVNPLKIIVHPQVIISGLLIFLSVGVDIGFSYWIAEYFNTELNVPLRFASAVAGVYLTGVISGRFITSRLVRHVRPATIMKGSLILALVSLTIFLSQPIVSVKIVFSFFYGLGIGPLFPLLMSRGVAAFPAQPGSVTGILFSMLSLGGMVFPFLLGTLAETTSIEKSYFFIGGINLILLIAIHLWNRRSG
ncbi:MAG: hypothetical protein DRP87_03190 [Spirochaetes bacterium]|nr:MAG: hypothetical protein DRP87_03190 [Spirochaetota bacterium]